MDTGGAEEGGGEIYGESNVETYNTICKTDNQWALQYHSGNSSRYSVTSQRGRMGREMGRKFGREGTWVYLWLTLVDV